MKKQLIPTLVLPPESPGGMAENSHRRASSPLLSACLPQPILEEEEENLEISKSTKPPNTLPVPSTTSPAMQDLCSPQFLCVDESKRPRAHSDPSVKVGGFAGYILPEITVTEDDGGGDSSLALLSAAKAGSHLFLKEPLESIRKRSNTCPEDLFRPNRKGRPATPPPTDIVPVLSGKRRAHSAGGSRRFSFNFAPPPVAMKSPTSVSFAHHKLSKVSEDLGSERVASRGAASGSRVAPLNKPSTYASTQNTVSDNDFCSTSISATVANLDSVSDNLACSSPPIKSTKNIHEQNEPQNINTNKCSDSNVSSNTNFTNRIPASSNGTGSASERINDLSSSDMPVSQSGKTAALLSESIRTLNVTDRRSCDSSSESASGLPLDSLSSWRSGDKADTGHLTAV